MVSIVVIWIRLQPITPRYCTAWKKCGFALQPEAKLENIKHKKTDVPVTFFGTGEVAWISFCHVTPFRGDILASRDMTDPKFR